jgi:hypothetical protein
MSKHVQQVLTGMCKHYPEGGMTRGAVCQAGISFETVQPMQDGPQFFPCFTPGFSYLCKQFEAISEAEARQRLEAVEAMVEHYRALTRRERTDCPDCGATILVMVEVGGNTFARPCGHRLWLGDVPEAWQAKDED